MYQNPDDLVTKGTRLYILSSSLVTFECGLVLMNRIINVRSVSTVVSVS